MKTMDDYSIAQNDEQYEYGIVVARQGSTPIRLSWKSHLKRFMKTNYTSNRTIMTSHLHRSNPSSIMF